jgi:hypothetical protein
MKTKVVAVFSSLILTFFLGIFVGGHINIPREVPREVIVPREAKLETAKTIYETNNVLISQLHWKDLESTDYRAYKRNLQSIGCPEQTIADILRADITSQYQDRLGKLRAKAQLADRFGSKAEKARIAQDKATVEKEMNTVLTELLGEYAIPPADISAYSYIAKEKQKQVAAIVKKYATPSGLGPWSSQEALIASNDAVKARNAEIQAILSPEEYENYMLINSGQAKVTQHFLAGIAPTEEEFRKVFSAIEPQGLRSFNGKFDSAVDQKFREALSPQRYEELMNLQKPESKMITQQAQMMGLDSEDIRRVVQILSARPDAEVAREELNKFLPERTASTLVAMAKSMRPPASQRTRSPK